MAIKQTSSASPNSVGKLESPEFFRLTCTAGRWETELMTTCRKAGSSCLTGLNLAKVVIESVSSG